MKKPIGIETIVRLDPITARWYSTLAREAGVPVGHAIQIMLALEMQRQRAAIKAIRK